MYSANLFSTDSVSSRIWGPVPVGLQVKPNWFSASRLGGCLSAEISLSGDSQSLLDSLEWLRRPVEIYDSEMACVWWGYVSEVRVTVSGRTITRSLKNMVNQVAVAYSTEAADGTIERETTSWTLNTASIAKWGTKEKLLSLSAANAQQAEQRRDEILTRYASAPVGVAAGGDLGGMLICDGWWQSLSWDVFQRLQGRQEQEGESDVVQPIGWRASGTRFAFQGYDIHSIDAQLAALKEGMWITIAGSTSNNWLTKIVSGGSDDPVVYTATTIYFEADDDIKDSANGLDDFRAGSIILIEGSAGNTGSHLLETADESALTTEATAFGVIHGEAAGPSITLRQGHSVETESAMTTEAAGDSVTVTLWGYRIAQAFVATESMTVDKIAVQVGKVGTPTDTLRVALYSDSSNTPNASLASATIAPADLDEYPDWRWFDIADTAITATTQYWIVVERTGTLESANYYELQMINDGTGRCMAYDHSTWVDHPQSQRIGYRVWGTEDNITQIRRMLTDGGQFFTAYDLMAATGIKSNQYRNNDLTTLNEIESLLDMGTTNDKRLYASVNRARVVQIDEVVGIGDLDDESLIWATDGTLRAPAGGFVSGLGVGQWVLVDGLPVHFASVYGVQRVFVEEAQIDCESGNWAPVFWTKTLEDEA